VARDVEGREAERAALRHEELEGRDLEILLQQLVEGVAVELAGRRRHGVALLRREPLHGHELGDDLGLDFAEGHGLRSRPSPAPRRARRRGPPPPSPGGRRCFRAWWRTTGWGRRTVSPNTCAPPGSGSTPWR